MFIALNKEKKRIHISDSEKGKDYYCPICEKSLSIRKGTVNAPHFAHKKNSNCTEKDGWHYDMSDWHYYWQNQFPIEAQEYIFKHNNKIHRADVYIDKIVFEFQHSPISESEFDDRNNFYNDLGFHVVWIFDVRDKIIEHIRDAANNSYRVFSWKYPIKFLEKSIELKDKVTIFLQIDDSIWDRQMNYREILDFQNLDIRPNIIKIEDFIVGFSEFISKDYYSDFEILDRIIKFSYKNRTWYNYKLKPNVELLCDYLSYENYIQSGYYNYEYGYCPKYMKDIRLSDECHGCYNFISKYNGCNYRFKDFPINDVKYFYNIKRNDEGRIIFIDCLVNNERKRFNMYQMPSNIRSIKSFINTNPNMRVARFKNVNNDYVIQLGLNEINQLMNNNKCYGKLCQYNKKVSLKEYQIYNWNKPVWLLIWFKNKDDLIKKTTISNTN